MTCVISMLLSLFLIFSQAKPLVNDFDPEASDQEAFCYLGEIDNHGDLLDGANSYILHFDKDQLPPVDGSWSLAIYSSSTFLYTANSINRHWISNRTDGLEYNADGSLDIYIQRQLPAAGISNWLPAPRRKFFVLMRLFQPRPEVLKGLYVFPTVRKIQ